MKKTILITIGILTLLIAGGVWMYLFSYGVPKNSAEIFARFGLGNEEVVSPITPTETTVDVADASVEGALQNLRQLTTRPVAGASFTENGIRYVEQGTGHIYDINLTNGEETLISGTTIPKTREALFSNSGLYVAITAHDGDSKTLVGSVDTGVQNGGSLTGAYLPLGATEIYFAKATGTMRYLLKEPTGSSGYSYNIKKDSGTQLFNIPLRDIHVLWGDSLYVYTTPTSKQKGYLYRVQGNNLEYTVPGAFGLMAHTYGDGVIITSVIDTNVSTIAYTNTKEIVDLPVPFITEKCTQSPAEANILYCSSPYNFETRDFPDNWYKGVVSYSDLLWRVDVETSESTVLSNFLDESGREIDVSKIGSDVTGKYLYLINKNDNTLWLFDTSV